MPDNYFTVDDPNIPKELLGPTGLVFVHPKGFSTELVTTVEADGKHHVFPLLVPGQEGIGDLLGGQKPTKKQIKIAFDWAKQNGDTITADSEEEAQKALSARHGLIEQALFPYVQPYLQQR